LRGLSCRYDENGLVKYIDHRKAVRSRSDYFSFREDGTLREGQTLPFYYCNGWLYCHTYPGGSQRWEVTVREGRPRWRRACVG
jgi:hypothetical protein